MTEPVIPIELLNALMGECQVEEVQIAEVSLSHDYVMGMTNPVTSWVHFMGRYSQDVPRAMPRGRVWLVWTHD